MFEYPSTFKRTAKLDELLTELDRQVKADDLDKKLVTKVKNALDAKLRPMSKTIEEVIDRHNRYCNPLTGPVWMELSRSYAHNILSHLETAETLKATTKSMTEAEFKAADKYSEYSFKESKAMATKVISFVQEQLKPLKPIANLIAQAENMKASKKRTIKTVMLFSGYSKEKRDELFTELKEDYPEVEMYTYSQNGRYYGEPDKYQIKATGTVEDMEILKESIKERQAKPLKPIINILTKELEPLHVMFIEETKKWSKADHEHATKLAKMSKAELIEKFGKDGKIAPAKAYMLEAQFVIARTPVQEYIDRHVKMAEDHYRTSLIRLAGRISYKQMDTKKIEAVTEYSSIGQNISTVLSDGTITVRAWTIIAQGPVQRPHYRYLVK